MREKVLQKYFFYIKLNVQRKTCAEVAQLPSGVKDETYS